MGLRESSDSLSETKSKVRPKKKKKFARSRGPLVQGDGKSWDTGTVVNSVSRLCRPERHKTAVQFSVAPICRYERHKTACAVQ